MKQALWEGSGALRPHLYPSSRSVLPEWWQQQGSSVLPPDFI